MAVVGVCGVRKANLHHPVSTIRLCRLDPGRAFRRADVHRTTQAAPRTQPVLARRAGDGLFTKLLAKLAVWIYAFRADHLPDLSRDGTAQLEPAGKKWNLAVLSGHADVSHLAVHKLGLGGVIDLASEGGNANEHPNNNGYRFC